MADLDTGLVSLDASATREVENDVLSLTFTVTREGKEAQEVQQVLRGLVKNALLVIQPHQKVGEVEVETAGLQVTPKYGRNSTLVGYSGSASIILKGTDTSTISKLGGEVTTMPISDVSQSVSRTLRESKEAELIAEAAENFKVKARQIAGLFGADGGFTVQAINVSVSGNQPRGGGKLMSIGGAMSAESAPIEVSTGKSTLTASVRGTIILDHI